VARILVAEDEPDILLLIERRLAREGHSLTTADNGTDALRIALEERPDLLVLDWMMPGLSGIEVCSALRAHPEARSIRVLMLTARAQESDLTAAYDAGVDEFVIKPFRPGDLQDRVAALLDRA
jgi:DNA-binding response OmpR family regulator